MASSDDFYDVLSEIEALHDRKQADYGRPNDPFSNVRSSEDFGVEGWVGALVRANDKMRRLQKFAEHGELANESVEDSLLDLATYAAIGLVLYREQTRNAEIDEIESWKCGDPFCPECNGFDPEPYTPEDLDAMYSSIAAEDGIDADVRLYHEAYSKGWLDAERKADDDRRNAITVPWDVFPIDDRLLTALFDRCVDA